VTIPAAEEPAFRGQAQHTRAPAARQPLLSIAVSAVRQLLTAARPWTRRRSSPESLRVSGKQDAFVTGTAAELPGGPHRHCQNHLLLSLAQPVPEADSPAKVTLRRKTRGLRSIERDIPQGGRDGEGRDLGGSKSALHIAYHPFCCCLGLNHAAFPA
jgi:hypothetical protein